MTREAVAQRAGVRTSTVSLLENGDRRNPHVFTLVKLAPALRTSVDYLVGLTDDSTAHGLSTVDGELQAVINLWPELSPDERRLAARFVSLLQG